MKKLHTTYQYSPHSSERSWHDAGRKSLAGDLKAVYRTNHYEVGHLETHTSIQSNQSVKVIEYKKLPEVEVAGYPYAIDYNEKGELQCHFPLEVPNAHEIILGATGSGKTSCLVEPRIRALSTKRNKASMFLTDVKGELFQRHAEYLKKQGYRVYLINFKDVLHSDSWNPLLEIYESWMRQAKLKSTLRPVWGKEHLDEYRLQDDPSKYQNAFWCYGGKAFSSEKAAKRCYDDEAAAILAETSDLIHQLTHALIPDSLVSKNDPTWVLGARDILVGLIYAILEDALDERSGLTGSHINLMNVQTYYETIRSAIFKPTGIVPLLQTKKLEHKSDKDNSIKLLRGYLENAGNTTRSYLGVFRGSMQEWFTPKIFAITNSNTINLDADDCPYAIFLTTRDSERSDFTIAGMFIDWVYRKLLEKADRNGGNLEREFYFILDEFSNIPAIKDFTNKITASRSRSIFFAIMLQSYAQLNEGYGASAAQTIIDNCDSAYLSCKNYETKAKYAKECGRQTIPSLESVLNPAVSKMVEVPLLTISRLEELELGQMYLRRAGLPLLLSRCEPCFTCPEFRTERYITPEEMGIESPPYNAERFRYQYLETDQSMKEYCRTRNPPSQPVAIEPELWKEIMA